MLCRLLACVAFTLLALGCASELQDQEKLASAAGFKVITPQGADQQALLAKLPPRKVTMIHYKGKSYYVLPDVDRNLAYVGGQKEYQAYCLYQHQQDVAQQNMAAAQMNEMNSINAMNWGAWGGWGYVGPMGFVR